MEIIACSFEARSPRVSVQEVAVSRCTLLVVDDDSLQISALVRSVRGLAELRVYSATTSSEAVAMAAKHSLDAAIVDLLLGTESGVALVEALRRAHPKLRIAALSAAASSAVIEAASAAGADVVLRKPVSLGTAAVALDLDHEGLRAQHFAEYPTVERVVWEHVRRAHDDFGGNVVRTARVLGLTRNTVKKQLAKPRPL